MKSKSTNSSPYTGIKDFMIKHIRKSGDTTEITHTRIGDNKDIKGGSYHINDDELPLFLQLYYRDVIAKGNPEYLTEKQREKDGPIAVDLDFRYNYDDITTRQHDKEVIEDLVDIYLDELKNIFQFDDETQFQIFVMEKPDVNRLESKKITKDGIHLIFGIQADRIIQTILRDKVIGVVSENWEGRLPLTNDWESVLDKQISTGSVNWQLYGSRKPDNQQYQLTYIYDIQFDTTDNEFQRASIELSKFDISKNIEKLSVRYKDFPSYFVRNEFTKTYNEYKQLRQSGGGGKLTNSMVVSRPINPAFGDTHLKTLLTIKNAQDMQYVTDVFLDSIKSIDYELKESYYYAMALPPKYYDTGSYEKWIRVGWALKNISYYWSKDKRGDIDILLVVWLAFSARAKSFNYMTEIPSLIDRWRSMNYTNAGLTKRSLMYWAKEDAYEEFKKIRENSIDHFVELSLNSKYSGILSNSKSLVDNDVAEILYQLYKDSYVCSSFKENKWYMYSGNRWTFNDSGVSLSIAISTELKDLYIKKREETFRQMQSHIDFTPDNEDVIDKKDKKDKQNPIRMRLQQLVTIADKLGMTAEKKNIMTQAKEKFWDTEFTKKLDTNPDLICFKNGVVDFKNRIFRSGLPEDYLSMCTNINYLDIDKEPEKYAKTVDEINTFMNQLFPEKELCEYMWDHLASTLTGYTSAQTFNMYIGIGQNGKSVLVNLMSKILGDYKEDAAVSLLTGPPPKAGSATPELMALKGKRYVVMQEPTKGDKINDGTMKLFTSGIDTISGRQLYGTSESFIPQMKLVVCSNIMLEVKTNDHGTWRRIRVVNYKSLFTENPVQNDAEKPYQYKIDYKITDKFDDWKEVFAAMLVKRAFKTGGIVKDCDIVMAASNKYRESQDYISEFIRDNIAVDTNGKIKKTELNSQFKIWYESTYGRCSVSPKDVHEYMDKRFGSHKNATWTGVRMRYERDDLNIPISNSDISDVSENEL
uniref:SF3 helicase domain-containing protein n=1 Tax=viral metagenome TaxID=1070528 RepID=A0A6C0DR37_9ZZZZ